MQVQLTETLHTVGAARTNMPCQSESVPGPRAAAAGPAAAQPSAAMPLCALHGIAESRAADPCDRPTTLNFRAN